MHSGICGKWRLERLYTFQPTWVNLRYIHVLKKDILYWFILHLHFGYIYFPTTWSVPEHLRLGTVLIHPVDIFTASRLPIECVKWVAWENLDPRVCSGHPLLVSFKWVGFVGSPHGFWGFRIFVSGWFRWVDVVQVRLRCGCHFRVDKFISWLLSLLATYRKTGNIFWHTRYHINTCTTVVPLFKDTR